MSKFKKYNFFRYFKEEKECPYKSGYQRDAWWFERAYSLHGADVCTSEMLERFVIAGLHTFYKDSNLPITYLAFILYKRSDYGSLFDGIEGFKHFIEQSYPYQ